MVRRQWMLMSLLMVTMIWTSGCGTIFGRTAAAVLVPVEEENRLGQQVAQQLDQELTYHPDSQIQRYVRDLGTAILRNVDNVPQGIEFRFVVVDDPDTINAFAIPGGGIYIYSGLMKTMDNEAELAAVLSHEIAHVTRRHIAQRLVAAYGADAVARAALGEEPGIVAQLVTAVVAQGFMLRYSRDQERDADDWGFQYLVRANYNPEAFVTFFRKLQGHPSPPTFLSSHPPPGERAETIAQMIRELDRRPTRTEEERFIQMRNRL